MKKTITKQDGSVEVVEGTAEEIADYERKLKGHPVLEAPKPGPGLLTDELQRLRDGMINTPWWTSPFHNNYPQLQHHPTCQMIEAQKGWWCVTPPMCTCGLIAYPIQGGTIRYTTGTTIPVTGLPDRS